MGRTQVHKLAFNRGLVSKHGLARADIKRLALASEIHRNFPPRVLGSQSIRPGFGYLGASASNARAFHIPFVFSVSDKALLEFTDLAMRVWVDDALVTRPSVSSAVANDGFDTDLTSWTDADESGATSAWVTGGYLGLTGNGTAFAIRRQKITVASGDQSVEHALRIVVNRGPVVLRVGSSSGEDDYIAETSLDTGVHSLALTPTGNFWIEFKSRLKRIVYVDSCSIEAAGVMSIATPWPEATTRLMRHDQSGDIVYIGAVGYQQRKIERRSTTSWSVTLYQADDGPFFPENITTTTIAAAAISGNTTLTASKPLFRLTHVGALFRITSAGQQVSASVTAQNTFTGTIRVTGVGTARGFTVSRTNTWVATVTLQRSFDEGASWIDVTTYTTNGSVVFSDGLDNQDILYRIGVKTGAFTSGQVDLTLAITTGSITGVARITDFTSSTSVGAEIIKDLGGTAATEFWNEAEWSDYRGWPHAPALIEGRLQWAGKDGTWMSISDSYYAFDDEFEGDAGPISRTIGAGPVDTIQWAVAMQRLLLGGEGAEFSGRSSSFDSPITPTDFMLKPASRQGSAPVAAVVLDDEVLFVQRGGTRVYELAWGEKGVDYETTHVSALVPEIGKPSIVKMAVQKQPDTRVHCVRSDGTVAMLVYDKVERVLCWLVIDTDGEIEDAAVLPGSSGSDEDQVYYSVKRTINGATVRYLERWAMASEAVGGTVNKIADAFKTYSGVPVNTITGADHLEGERVVVWADGRDVGTDANGNQTYQVSGGQFTLETAAAEVVYGLPYTAQWQSAKLGELADQEGSLLASQNINRMGLILADTHAKGIRIGQNFENLEPLPNMEEWVDVDQDRIWEAYAQQAIVLPGEWSSDARICLQAAAPRPCTVLAALAEVEHHG